MQVDVARHAHGARSRWHGHWHVAVRQRGVRIIRADGIARAGCRHALCGSSHFRAEGLGHCGRFARPLGQPHL
eukprot:4928352-Lingulodinium_polyedra.AAC.1